VLFYGGACVRGYFRGEGREAGEVERWLENPPMIFDKSLSCGLEAVGVCIHLGLAVAGAVGF
jgi:hypothetical protein